MKVVRQLVTVLLVIGVLSLCIPKANASMQEARRLLILIDKISDTECEVIYSGSTFSCKFVARFARAFLVTHYNKETAEEWVDKWCYRSRNGQLIWVVENNKYKLANKRLKEELKNQHGRTNN